MKIKLWLFFCGLAIILSACDGRNSSVKESTQQPPDLSVEITANDSYLGSTCGTEFYADHLNKKLVGARGAELIFELPLPETVVIGNGLLQIQEPNQTSYRDCNGQLLCSQFNVVDISKFNVFTTPEQPLNLYQSGDGLWGYLNIQGIWAVQPQFSYAQKFQQGEKKTYAERNNGYEPGILDDQGNFEPICLSSGYYWDTSFSNGRLLAQVQMFALPNKPIFSAYVTEDNTILYSEAKPKVVDGYNYENARSFSEGTAAVQINGLWGYINLDGHIIIHPQYANAFSFNQGVAVVVKSDGSFGCIDKDGKEQGKFISIKNYEPTGDYCNGQYLIINKENNYRNIADENGVVKNKDDISIFVWDNSKLPIWHQSKGFYLPHCNTLISGVSLQLYDNILETDGSIYDRATGQCLGTFRWVDTFHEGLAVAEEKIYGPGKYGYINQAGEWVVPPCFTKAESFNGGLAYVELEDQTRGLIANPLIYPEGWDGDELIRAELLGLPLPQDDSYLTGQELKECVSALTEKYELSFNVELPEANVPLTRQELAYILTEISRELGNIVDYFQCSYQDTDLIEEACLSSVAYVTYLNIFEIDNGNFRPTEQITNQEAAKVLVRFFERAVSDYLMVEQ